MVDLGCWPGSWLQLASQEVGPTGLVLGIDRVALDPPLKLANVVTLEGDLTDPTVAVRLLDCLGGADVIGPVLLGMARPVHILQRGCSVQAVLNLATVASVDWQARNKLV
mgnify:CR=1 FL=1